MLHYTLRSFSAAASFVLLLSSCTALTGKTASQNVDDATMTASVKTKLATQEAASTLTRIGVSTDRGIVHLEPIRITQIWYIEGMAQSKKRRQRAPVNKVTTGVRVSEQLWAVLQPLIPKHVNPHRFGGGKPRPPARRCADAVFYVLRTGCQWAALDATALCPHSTAHARFQHWVEAGVFLQLWQAGGEQFEELKGLDWQWLSLDGALTKAPLGGEKNRRHPHGAGQKRREPQRADGGAWRPAGPGRGRRQSAGHETARAHALQYRSRAARAERRAAPRAVSG